MLYAYRLHRAVHDRRADRDCSSRRSASTCTSPTRTSSSRTSTTSWSAARSWAISAACTTGGRRSAAACTTRGSRSSARRHHLRRLQPDVLPAVRPRLSRHAAALPRLSGGVPGAERAVVGRRVDSRRRLSDSDGLSDVVAALRPGRRLESVGRRRPRVDDDVAAADREFRAKRPIVTWEAVRVSRRRVEGHVA